MPLCFINPHFPETATSSPKPSPLLPQINPPPPSSTPLRHPTVVPSPPPPYPHPHPPFFLSDPKPNHHTSPTNLFLPPPQSPPPRYTTRHPTPWPSPRAMAAMAPDREDHRRSASIANLLLPSDKLPSDRSSLVSLSHLAASMKPLETTTSSSTSSQRRRRAADAFARTASVPAALRDSHINNTPTHPTRPTAPHPHRTPDRTMSPRVPIASHHQSSMQLGVARTNSKRLSRTKSAFAGRSSLRAAAAAAAVGVQAPSRDNNASAIPISPGGGGGDGNPHSFMSPAGPSMSGTPSPTVLRAASVTPLGVMGSSKQTSASNSVESCVPAASAARKERGRYSTLEMASTGLVGRGSGVVKDPMVIDGEYEGRERSSSSLDAKLLKLQSRSRTTPDAKRAQNRESAKRFRVAQKKRWADLQETVERKNREIERLKGMLQEITNQNLAQMKAEGGIVQDEMRTVDKMDALAMAELSLFLKLMGSVEDNGKEAAGSASVAGNQPPIAASIGSLYRVIVAKTDGSVLGVRHLNKNVGNAMGGEVGSLLWDHVHSSDTAHLRFTVVHANKMASVLGENPTVFSYRRREVKPAGRAQGAAQADSYMRMKGCIYPLQADENNEVHSIILAEFVEI